MVDVFMLAGARYEYIAIGVESVWVRKMNDIIMIVVARVKTNPRTEEGFVNQRVSWEQFLLIK